MRARSLYASLLMLGFLALGPANSSAATVTIGAPGAPMDGNAAPFGDDQITLLQQVVDASFFSGPLNIASVRFFLNNFDHPSFGISPAINTAAYTLTFATVSYAPSALSTTPGTNLDPLTGQVFFSGTVGGPVSGSFDFSTTPGNFYAYDPAAGNLLLQIQKASVQPDGLTLFNDRIDSTVAGVNALTCTDASDPNTCVIDPNFSGLVVTFSDVNAALVPEPGTYALTVIAGAALAVSIRRRKHQR